LFLLVFALKHFLRGKNYLPNPGRLLLLKRRNFPAFLNSGQQRNFFRSGQSIPRETRVKVLWGGVATGSVSGDGMMQNTKEWQLFSCWVKFI
jgi:hypothetical protein